MTHEFAQTIIKGWKTGKKKGSLVDSFVISPEFELMGRQLVNDLDWGIEPGNNGTITHRFEKGKVFKLGATGDWFSKKGDINAFHAIISVKEK